MFCPAVVRAPTAEKRLILTFDDGPTPYTSQILDTLRATGVKAVFFVCGAAAERHPDLVRRIKAEGHLIGNHTYSHPYLHLKPAATIAAELDRTQAVLEKITGERPTLFRPPFGVRWFPLAGLLKERSLTMVLWTARTYDGRLDAESIAASALKQLTPGGILVLHDGFEAKADELIDRSQTAKALPAIIAGAKAAGYTFDLLKSGVKSDLLVSRPPSK
jgi:peptidoglycan/xylan/chitin deacetylase (PgdA/CDA1 family)